MCAIKRIGWALQKKCSYMGDKNESVMRGNKTAFRLVRMAPGPNSTTQRKEDAAQQAQPTKTWASSEAVGLLITHKDPLDRRRTDRAKMDPSVLLVVQVTGTDIPNKGTEIRNKGLGV
jgi:hypothetical protein